MSNIKGGKCNIGLAEEIVTPPVGVPLVGYTDRNCTGVHDDLHVRVFVLKGRETVAILSLPVVGFESDFTLDLRKLASQKTGIDEKHILLHATHTHSAPCVEGDFRKMLIEKSVVSLENALETCFAGKIGVGLTQVDQCGKNRRYLDYGGLPVDPDVGIIKIEDMQGQIKAVIFNYACHGTCLDVNNTLVTEDWPYYAIQAIKKQTQPEVFSMFLGSAAGDINPGYSAGLSAVSADIPVRTWQEAQRIGERLGTGVVEKLPEIETSDCIRLKNMTSYVDLPLRQTYPVTIAEAEEKVSQAKQQLKGKEFADKPNKKVVERARVDLFFADLVLQGAKKFHSGEWGKSVKAELQTILLGDTVITTFPGEVFFEAATAVKKESPAAKTLIIGLANTYEAKGYLPTREAYEEGDYEVYESYYSEDASDTLIAASVKAVKEIWNA